ncbi:Acg family FMN-binding oxidoreductase [Joostella sp. CR20]|uniref:Acg family FMN-binding oxidoreductase n=1 Tax=Joostella sp. CR20 TaxID=2804312 RepID=UPI00313AAB20
MKRKEFILKAGAIITATTFVSKFSFANSIEDSKLSNKRAKRPNPDVFSQPILKAIALGINAPSPHNTQSWKFKIIDSVNMLLYVDENILLPETDPPSRQIHMGAGCFIETAVLGAQRYGYDADVVYFPEGYQGKVDFGQKPVASISLKKGRETKDPLEKYIESRQTNRRKYRGDIITHEEFDTLKTLSGASHSKLKFINTNFEPYFNLFYKGFEIESKTFNTNEETRNLFRFNEQQRAEKGDGISIPQMGYKGLMAILAEKSLAMGDKEKWHSEKSISLSLKNVQKGIDSTKGIVVWYTENNEFIDWIKSGRDFVRFSLALIKLGLYAHPYNQVIQEYKEMEAVQSEMNALLEIEAPQKIQMIVRLGRSSKPYYSYRREFNTYLVD